MNLVIPGVQSAERDLGHTLTLLSELLQPCREKHLARAPSPASTTPPEPASTAP